MAVNASEVIARVKLVLADQSHVRWTENELALWCVEAVRQVVLARPDAYAVTNSDFTLANGSRQVIGLAGAVRLLRVVRNTTSARKTAIRECSRVALDSEIPDWHTPISGSDFDTSGAKHYVFDNVDPLAFYVYPSPAAGNHRVEIIYSAVPAITASANANLVLGDQYLGPLVDWVLYRAFSKDAEYAGNSERCAHYLNSFATSLQISHQAGFVAATPQAATPLPAGAGWKRTGA